jgi:hypothetical protein
MKVPEDGESEKYVDPPGRAVLPLVIILLPLSDSQSMSRNAIIRVKSDRTLAPMKSYTNSSTGAAIVSNCFRRLFHIGGFQPWNIRISELHYHIGVPFLTTNGILIFTPLELGEEGSDPGRYHIIE